MPSARHGCCNALLGGRKGPAMRLDRVERNTVLLQQHPAQHVLRRSVAGFGCRAIEFGGTGLILFDALTFEIERRQVSLTDGVAGFCRQASASAAPIEYPSQLLVPRQSRRRYCFAPARRRRARAVPRWRAPQDNRRVRRFIGLGH